MSANNTGRIASIDIFRALTMFLMIFVNDIPSLKNIPHWLLHAEATEDMLGFSDIIFPAFLFCMGMSAPIAIETGLKKGKSILDTILHILYRTVALIVMGLCLHNSGGVTGGLSHQTILLLMVGAFFLCFSVYPKCVSNKKYISNALKLLGVAIIVFIIIYKDINGKPFKVSWWGILALIGWTYFICSIVYLFLRNNIRKISIAFCVIVALSILNHLSFIPAEYSCKWLFLSFVPFDWTLHAFGFAGVLCSVIMTKYADALKPMKFISIMVNIGVGALILGVITHSYWIINKIQATPSWLFYTLAILFPLFGLIYWISDVKKTTRLFDIIMPAGNATLTCYMIPYIWYSIIQIAGIHYPGFMRTGIVGLVCSLLFSLIIIQIARLLVKCSIKLKI
jgi:hypothetical protein